jgi:hypothetical protein
MTRAEYPAIIQAVALEIARAERRGFKRGVSASYERALVNGASAEIVEAINSLVDEHERGGKERDGECKREGVSDGK